ncbi:MAG: methyl-accepting chemotaxis protein [Clostridiales bacterium]|nr:methyl-accepting chemotaxis protein [Clostridiales bacterium]
MSWFKNRKISTKIITGFTLIAVLAGIVGAAGILNINTVNNAGTILFNSATIPSIQLGEISINFQRTRVAYRDMLLYPEPSKQREEYNKILEMKKENDGLLESFKGTIISDAEMEKFDQLYAKYERYNILTEDFCKRIMDGEDANKLLYDMRNSEITSVTQEVIEMIEELFTEKQGEALVLADVMAAATNRAIYFMIGVIIAAIIISIIYGRFLIRFISIPIRILKEASNKLALGDTNVYIIQKTKDEIGELMGSFGRMVKNIEEHANIAQKIAEGDLDIDIQEKSDKDILALSMKKVIYELRCLIDDANALSNAAIVGNLEVRGDAERFEGGYREIISGMNKTMDAISEPLKIGIEFIYNVAEGTQMELIPNEEKYKGYYNQLIVNMNNVLKSLLIMLNEAGVLTKAAMEGNLSHRADISKLKGGYIGILGGFNNALDAVINPVKEAADVLKEMAKGNLSARVLGDYQGDHAEIKNALNFTGETIQEYIYEISDILGNMANKDFTGGIEREYLGDFIKLKDSINYILGQFNFILTEINKSSEQVEAAASQVAASSQNLSRGSSEQAGSVEEISATISQVAEQTKENAKNAQVANDLSSRAKNDAQDGNAQMGKMLRAMNEIKESSKSISNIIKVIDEIAFQTNILALNAAVEAARAGEHGKGFAVVAEEVRNLAARSAKAAKETTELIDNSINKVEEGYMMANSTAEALNKIVVGVADAVNIVGMIAGASNHQSDAISEINQGIEQISQVIQYNTATAEESASASEQMAGQAQMLKEMIQEFKLKDITNGSAEDRIKKLGEPKYYEGLEFFPI